MQNYNGLLTLARLYRLADALLVQQNDAAHAVCARLLRLRHVSFADINRVVAGQLAGVLQPALTAHSHGAYGRDPLGGLPPSPLCVCDRPECVCVPSPQASWCALSPATRSTGC